MMSFFNQTTHQKGSFRRFLFSPMSGVALIFILYYGMALDHRTSITLTDLVNCGALSSASFHQGLVGMIAGFPHLFTALFLHATRLHLAFDLILFILASAMLLRDLAGRYVLGLFLVTGWISHLLFLLTAPTGRVLLGSSGGTCGLLGTLVVLLVVKQINHAPGASWPRLTAAAGLSAFLLIEAAGSGGRVPLSVHGGGFLAGALIGLVIVWRRRQAIKGRSAGKGRK